MNPTLLIADSDAELCEIYDMCLSECGFEVETATSGLDCLEKLRRVKPSAIVLDRELRWGGTEGVLTLLREDGPYSQIPVVLTSAADPSLDGAACVQPPVVKVLPKPFSFAALLEALRDAVARNGRQAPVTLLHPVGSTECFIE